MSRVATDDMEASDAALRSVLERFGRCGRGVSIEDALLLTCGPVGSVGSYAHAALPLSRNYDAREVLRCVREHASRCAASVVLWASAQHDADLREAAGAAGLSPAGSGFERPGMITRERPAVQASRGVTLQPVRDPARVRRSGGGGVCTSRRQCGSRVRASGQPAASDGCRQSHARGPPRPGTGRLGARFH